MSECKHDNLEYDLAGWLICPDCKEHIDDGEYTEWQLYHRDRRIAELKAELAQYQWIPVSERLPDIGQRVLVWSKHYGHEYIDEWIELREAPVSFSSQTIAVGEGWAESEFDDIERWMPLPPPPADGGE